MQKFGFIVHAVDLAQVRRQMKLLSWLPDPIIKFCLKNKKPYVVSRISGLRSITGKEAEGFFIGLPLLPVQFLKLDEKFILNRLISACRIAEGLGAKIVGLGGYTSVTGDKGITISKSVNIAVTTGNSYTVALAIEGVLEAAKKMKVNLSKARAAVIGATGSIGNACTRMLSRYVSEIIIKARQTDRLLELQANVQCNSSCRVIIEDDAHKAVKGADIVILTTSAPEALIDVSEFKPGSVVCDISVPKNISGSVLASKDVFVFDGGMSKVPCLLNYGKGMELPNKMIYGCMAETMTLALEEKFESFSLGNNLSLDKIGEISRLGRKHGFGLALDKK